MTETNNESELAQVHTHETDEEDPMYKIFMEIQSEISRLKKRPPRDFGHFMVWFTGTFMGFVRDLAFRANEDSAAIAELYEQIGTEDEGDTRILKEDAEKLKLVLDFAKEVASGILSQASTPDEVEKLKIIVQTTEECLKLVEESTVEDEEEENEEEGTEEESQTNEQN